MIIPRHSVAQAHAYSPPLEGRRDFIRLDFNENTEADDHYSLYPEYDELTERLAKQLSISPENLMLTNGSSEGIFLTCFAFVEPGRSRALTSRPTFSLIPHYLHLVGAELTEVPVTSTLNFDIQAIEQKLARGVNIAIFASPDNPTGAVLSSSSIEKWCEEFPHTLFLLDEAYAEYSDVSSLELTTKFKNLLVTRTFSKAWGLAGLRLGAIIGDSESINTLKVCRSPYSVNTEAVNCLLEKLPSKSKVNAAARSLIVRKEKIITDINKRGYQVVAGNANFYLLKMAINAKRFCSFCRQRGVLLRDRSSIPETNGMIRVTVGTTEENIRFLEVLDEFKRSCALIFDLDDTLVDTSNSYDLVVAKLIEQLSGKHLESNELHDLRFDGRFNDDWQASHELLRRRGVEFPLKEVIKKGKELYLSIAKEREEKLFDEDHIIALARKYRLFIFTGRPRDEYEPIWGEVLSPLFEKVYCVDDFEALPSKPAPDMLREIMNLEQLEFGAYIGNSVDDMKAARAAGIEAIGVVQTANKNLLKQAGADMTITSISELKEVYQA